MKSNSEQQKPFDVYVTAEKMTNYRIMHYTGRSGHKIEEIEAASAVDALLASSVSGEVVDNGETAAIYVSDYPGDPQHAEWYEAVSTVDV